jgi:uncharacterized membrane protein
MKIKYSSAGFLLITAMVMVACSTQKKAPIKEEACASLAPTYTENIKSIVENKCSVDGCHSRGRGDFRVFENFKRKADEGEIMNMVVRKKAMPPNGGLPENEINQIKCWLKDGAKLN